MLEGLQHEIIMSIVVSLVFCVVIPVSISVIGYAVYKLYNKVVMK